MNDASCDILVVGAGPAGASAALAAARAGAEVIMIDRRREIGSPARCAGFVPAVAMSPPEVFKETTCQKVAAMLAITPDGRKELFASPGFVVRRELFDRRLAEAAVREGAVLMPGARALHREGDVTAVRVPGGEIGIRSSVVIGADGPRSVVGSWIGQRNTAFITGIQRTVRLIEPLERIRIYFDRLLAGGYGWLFPAGKEARIGVGIAAGIGIKPSQALEWLVNKAGGEVLFEPGLLSVTGGLIPVGGLLKCRAGNILLAGDAAGLCHPLTGAGIAAALQSGRLAGEAASGFVKTGNQGELAHYGEEIDCIFKEALGAAVMTRRRMYGGGRGEAAGFSRKVRLFWMKRPPAIPIKV